MAGRARQQYRTLWGTERFFGKSQTPSFKSLERKLTFLNAFTFLTVDIYNINPLRRLFYFRLDETLIENQGEFEINNPDSCVSRSDNIKA